MNKKPDSCQKNRTNGENSPLLSILIFRTWPTIPVLSLIKSVYCFQIVHTFYLCCPIAILENKKARTYCPGLQYFDGKYLSTSCPNICVPQDSLQVSICSMLFAFFLFVPSSDPMDFLKTRANVKAKNSDFQTEFSGQIPYPHRG